jgi:hypothetical protein
MASGISSTFRQVGIATGIALLGTLFSNKVHDEVVTRIAGTRGLSSHAEQIAAAVRSGDIQGAIGQAPASSRPAVEQIVTAAFTSGLNRILLVAAVIAFTAGVVSLATIRSKDFARQDGPPPGP